MAEVEMKLANIDGIDESELNRIKGDDAYIANKIKLIPEEFYQPRERSEEDDHLWMKSKYCKNKKENAPKQAVKEKTRKAKKRDKYRKVILDSKEEKEDASDPLNSFDKFNAESEKKNKVQPARTLQELKDRLHEKLQKLRANRNTKGVQENTSQKNKRKRIEKKSTKSGTPEKHEASPPPVERKLSSRNSTAMEKLSLKERHELNLRSIETETSKLNENLAASLKGLTYGNIALPSTRDDVVDSKNNTASIRNVGDVKRLLKHAEKKKEHIERLKSSERDDDRRLAVEQKWDEIEEAATGASDAKKTNTKLLRKQLKRLQKSKKKKALEWKKRKEKVQHAQKEKSEKRTQNIKKKMKKKIETKLKQKGISCGAAGDGTSKTKRKLSTQIKKDQTSGTTKNKRKKKKHAS